MSSWKFYLGSLTFVVCCLSLILGCLMLERRPRDWCPVLDAANFWLVCNVAVSYLLYKWFLIRETYMLLCSSACHVSMIGGCLERIQKLKTGFSTDIKLKLSILKQSIRKKNLKHVYKVLLRSAAINLAIFLSSKMFFQDTSTQMWCNTYC